jgi:hypothetical protein
VNLDPLDRHDVDRDRVERRRQVDDVDRPGE